MDDQQQGLRPLSTTASRGTDPAPAVEPPADPGLAAAAGLASTGGDPDPDLIRLTDSLRAGLYPSGHGGGVLTPQLPVGADPFKFFADAQLDMTMDQVLDLPMEALGDTTVQHTQNLPKEALDGEASVSADAGGPAAFDRRVALMAQDMAAFGGLGHEGPRLARHSEGLRLDYFA